MAAWQRTPLILASASATRRAMLEAAGIAHSVVTSEVDEAQIKARLIAEGAGSAAICGALAEAKAAAVSAQYPDAWVIGGDSVVSVDGRLFSKSKSRTDAAEHLRAFSGRTMILDSAVALARAGTVQSRAGDVARLLVRPLSEAFMADYLDAEWPAISHCVGCFRIEGPGVHLFERIEGSHFTILGMPLLPLLALLRDEGVLTP